MRRLLMGNGLPRKLNVLLMFKPLTFSARRPLDTVLMLVSCFVLLLCSISPGHAADDFLDPAVAFKFSASEKPGEIDVRYKVADGYYMYRERFAFAVKKGTATLGEPQLPAGKVHFDQTFNKDVETYRGELVIRIPVKQASGPFDIAVTSQGCADQGICYPPMERVYHVSGAALQPAGANGQTSSAGTGDVPWYDRATNADYAQSLLESGGFFAIVGLYFVAGVVLSLLPCSYPMIPILSAIIIGEGARVTRSRGFGLSAAYVLGMALVYTALGVLAAMIGQSLGAWLQNPWVLGAFGVLLAIFAITLIAGVDIALPARWQNSVNQASQKRSGGKVVAVVVMGALSALVVGACMTAPLFAVLAFIAHTGNAWLGGAALFSMGVGLGVPLLIIGLGAGTLLPRAGNWMDGVKVFFGVVLLAAALWIVWPVLSAVAQMALAALWLLIAAAALGLFATDPLRPLAVFAARLGPGTQASAQQQSAPGETFAPVKSSAELDLALKAAGRPAMLDFYADWCVSCKEMEHLTFSDPRVRARLAQLNLMRADVTANNPDDQALLKRFKLFGPPGIIFFDAQGNEVVRVVGYESADTFLKSLDKLSAPTT
jgi:thiol:disulfide interchange protein DsbD